MGRAGARLWQELDDVSASSQSTTIKADEDNAGPASVTPGYKIRPIAELGTAGSSSPSPLHPLTAAHREFCMHLSMPTARMRLRADLAVHVDDQAEVRRSFRFRFRRSHQHDLGDGLGLKVFKHDIRYRLLAAGRN
jgi:hypothetical protein